MLDLSPEISALPGLSESARAELLARERRQVFSIHPEIRALAWGGAMLIAAAAAVLITNNLERLGPTLIAAILCAASAACYAWAWWRRGRASVVDDYVLLLAALLLSAAAGFIESQFDLFGAHGYRHFLVLAVAHGAVAYLFDSRLVLTLSVSALAAWIGVERGDAYDLFWSSDLGGRAMRLLTAAVATLTWREADRRYRAKRSFERPLEHFTANFALLAGLVLTAGGSTRLAGFLVTAVAASLAIAWGFRKRAELFVLYAFVYLVIVTDIVLVDWLGNDVAALLTITVSAVIAIVGLFVIHARFQRRAS
jgi:Predicted membrane protein (DUF2157)